MHLDKMCAMTALAVILTAMPLTAQERSRGLARQLTEALQSQKLTAIAVQDPDAPDRFVAALLYPDVQLLAIAAQYAAPALLQQQIGKHQYEEVYAALQQSGVPSTKAFFQDMKADGLPMKSGDAVDVLYEHVTAQTIFNPDATGSKGAAKAYAEKLAAADVLYSRLLSLLLAQARAGTATVP